MILIIIKAKKSSNLFSSVLDFRPIHTLLLNIRDLSSKDYKDDCSQLLFFVKQYDESSFEVETVHRMRRVLSKKERNIALKQAKN